MNLKKLIVNTVEDNFPSLTDKKKDLLSHLVFINILSNEFYDNRYYTASLVSMKKGLSGIHTNEYNNISNHIIYPCVHNIKDEYDYPDYDFSLDDIKKNYIFSDVYKIIETLQDITFYSNNVFEYVESLKKEQLSNPDFIPVLDSYSYLINGFDKLFLNNGIKHLMKMDKVQSDLCKNEVYLTPSYDYKKDIENLSDLINKEWLDNKDKALRELDTCFSKTDTIENFTNKNKNAVSKILEKIYEIKPFLNQKAKDQTVEYFYFETSKGKEYQDFSIERDTCFSVELLNDLNIKLAPFYNNIDDEDLQEHVIAYFLEQENELTSYFKNRFYGLDYLNDYNLKTNLHNQSYIIAKCNNETVGFISFDSLENNNKSVLKDISYVCIKDNFRGLGIVNNFYDKIAKIFIANNNILSNSMYSEQGKYKLPKLKQRIREQNPDFLMIDTAYEIYVDEEFQDNKQLISFIQDFNTSFIRNLKNNDANINPQNVPAIKNIYKQALHKIYDDSHLYKQMDFMELFNLKENTSKEINQIVNSLPQPKNKFKI